MRLSSRLKTLEAARTARDAAPANRHDWPRRWTHAPENRAAFETAVAEARRLAPGLARRDADLDAGLCSVALTIGVELMADEVGGREQAEAARLAFFESATRYQRETGDLFPVPGFGLREWGMGAAITLPILQSGDWPHPPQAATDGAASH